VLGLLAGGVIRTTRGVYGFVGFFVSGVLGCKGQGHGCPDIPVVGGWQGVSRVRGGGLSGLLGVSVRGITRVKGCCYSHWPMWVGEGGRPGVCRPPLGGRQSFHAKSRRGGLCFFVAVPVRAGVVPWGRPGPGCGGGRGGSCDGGVRPDAPEWDAMAPWSGFHARCGYLFMVGFENVSEWLPARFRGSSGHGRGARTRVGGGAGRGRSGAWGPTAGHGEPMARPHARGRAGVRAYVDPGILSALVWLVGGRVGQIL